MLVQGLLTSPGDIIAAASTWSDDSVVVVVVLYRKVYSCKNPELVCGISEQSWQK